MISHALLNRLSRCASATLLVRLLCLLLVAAGMPGCGKHDGAKRKGATTAPAAPAQRPFEYTLAPELSEQHPEQTAFLRHFLETCLAGDYEGYRKLIASGVEPESKARFDRVLKALATLNVDSIEPIDVAALPKPAFLVTARVTFVPEEEARRPRRAGVHKIGLLIVRESDEWRAALAPSELQPDEEKSTTSQPATGPSYPWDVEQP